MQFTFKTIEGPAVREWKEKGSKFYGIALSMRSEQELQPELEKIRITYPKASHYCFAYRLGTDSNRYRISDDGEPAGTAGRPILGAIDSAGLTYVLVVVVRYFGGTKLGVPGLIQAYKDTARLALEATPKVDKEYTIGVDITADYQIMGNVLDVLKHLRIDIRSKAFHEHCHITCLIPATSCTETIRLIKANLLGITCDRVTDTTTVSGCTITQGALSW